MIMLDNTVVNVALPSIQRSLHLKISELEWVVTGYALTFGAFMLTGGKLADLFGRRLIFVVGLVVFTASSLACGLAGSATRLIGARVVQGVGAALMNPATLSIITVTFPPRQRGNGDRHLGRRLRARARDRPARRRRDHRADQLELDLLHQHPGRPPRDRRRVRVHPPSRATPPASRSRTSPGLVTSAARPLRAQLRADRGEQLRLDVEPDPGLVRGRGGRARRLRPARAAPAAADARPRRSSGTAPSRARTP